MDFILNILIMSGIFAILCLSLNLIMGYGGMFHLGHGAFFAIGAYAAALISRHLGWPFLVELLMAAIVTALFGLIISYPSIRLKGDYLSFMTFGFAVVIYAVVNNWSDVTGGPVGLPNIPPPSLFGFQVKGDFAHLVLVLVFLLLIWLVTRRIVNAPYGRTIESMREDEVAATASGRNVNALRITVFCVGAFIAGIAGVLYVHYIGIADPTGFTTTVSFTIVSMTLIGGAGSLSGPIAGAFLIVIIPDLLRWIGLPGLYAEQIKNIIFSVVLIIIMMNRPQGLLGKLKF
jgi:branched-chain amino acid transport system permease protein